MIFRVTSCVSWLLPQGSNLLKKHLIPLVEEGVDAIALGCTHYPFLRKQVQDIVGPNVKVVDSGGAVARRLQFVLDHENLLSTEKGEDLYYTTGEAEKFESVAGKLMNRKIKAEQIQI